ncbi:tautomerase family protein [Chelatococcus asaccharovorans]|nr:tautomerase family protein [Chelatococcus asaccharovorans]MBS7701743.1 tautomerase family protein [Chelatococcus asaccharovorans]
MKPDVKAELMRRLTDVAVEVTGISKALFFVSVHELPDSDIAVGGVTVTELKAQLAAERGG